MLGLAALGGTFLGGPEVTPDSDTFPALAVEVAFTTDPGAAVPAWVDVTPDVRDVQVSRGRTQELDTYQAGACTVTLSNEGRTYDPTYASGPWFGQLVPMRRMRVRATFDGVTYPLFDGYVDSWDQQYDPGNNDAVAVLQATDGFKPLAAAELPPSVYQAEVEADGPYRWYKLDEPGGTTTVFEDVAKHDGTLVGAPTFGEAGLVDRDPGTAMLVDGQVSAAAGFQAETTRFAPMVPEGTGAFSIEFWVQCSEQTAHDGTVFYQAAAGVPVTSWVDVLVRQTGAFVGLVNFRVNSVTGAHSTVRVDDGSPHHVVCIRNGTDMWIYIDGVDRTGTVVGSAAAVPSGLATVGSAWGGGGLSGTLQHFAVYDYKLSSTRIAAHNSAGRTPWTGDTPAARLDRVLDEVEWPSALRDLDTGSSTMQGADLGVSALTHAQKVEQSEFGSLFMTRDGKVRLIERTGRINLAEAATFGDGGGSELGYTSLTLDYSDQKIRNSVTVSRSEGKAQTIEDADSVAAYLRHSYTREGLIHNSDLLSRHAAEFLVSEYAEPQLRVTGMTVAPKGAPTTLFPQVLGRELGDEVTVKRRPQGVGSAIDQDSVIEGVFHSIGPKQWETTWSLSPAFAGAFLQLDNSAVTIEGSNPGRIFF